MPVPRAPVALFIFNRPDLTARVWNVIRTARPPVLLVSADGPRPDRPGERELCEQTRAIVKNVDWPCEVHTKFEDENLGCHTAMPHGVDWVFSVVDRAILIEDDCVPDPSFFPFCEELLERYQDDTRVMQISGSNLEIPASAFGEASYGFASFGLIWGWATWRRAWAEYDITLPDWPYFRDTGLMAGLHASRRRRFNLRREWDRIYRTHFWDLAWQYTVMTHHGLSAYPSANLVTNLGFRPDATHTTGAGSMAAVPARHIEFPLRHPPLVAENPHVERFLEREVLRAQGTAVTLLRRVLPSPRARRFLRRLLLPSARHGPS